jgi:membrane protein implicated in regulation of membrane protease activity
MAFVDDIVSAYPFWAWLAVGAVFLVVELLTGSGWMLWPAAAAALSAIAALLLPMPIIGQIAVFAAATLAATYVGRRFIPRPPPVEADINDTLARLIGRRGLAAGQFVGGQGRVFVDGKEWAAELVGDRRVGPGDKVKVTGVQGGARLSVERE